jgi:two-component system, OmpR family, response regulator CpxR
MYGKQICLSWPSHQQGSRDLSATTSQGNRLMTAAISISTPIKTASTIDVLLIDDDIELCELMDEFLTRKNIKLEIVHDGRRGLARALGSDHDLILLDVMLPGLDGFEVLRQVRRRSLVPIIMLTARATKEDRVTGLEGGADDYLSKPFDPDELLARVRAVLRRASRPPEVSSEVIDVNRVKLVPGTREVWAHGRSVDVTTIEFDILELIVRSAGRIVSRNELAAAIHQRPASPLDRSLDVHVSRLRKKLGDQGELIRTIRGVGYLFRAELAETGETA